jgi:hypothetical protein
MLAVDCKDFLRECLWGRLCYLWQNLMFAHGLLFAVELDVCVLVSGNEQCAVAWNNGVKRKALGHLCALSLGEAVHPEPMGHCCDCSEQALEHWINRTTWVNEIRRLTVVRSSIRVKGEGPFLFRLTFSTNTPPFLFFYFFYFFYFLWDCRILEPLCTTLHRLSMAGWRPRRRLGMEIDSWIAQLVFKRFELSF